MMSEGASHTDRPVQGTHSCGYYGITIKIITALYIVGSFTTGTTAASHYQCRVSAI